MKYILCVLAVLVTLGEAYSAEMSSASFRIDATVDDAAGQRKSSNSYRVLDSIGQQSPPGVFSGPNLRLESGFVYSAQFSLSLDQSLSGVLTELLKVQAALPTPNQKLDSAIFFVQKALQDWAAYSGPPISIKDLDNVLISARQAIDMLINTGLDTSVYQKMLADASMRVVDTLLYEYTGIFGAGNKKIQDATAFYGTGYSAFYAADYRVSVENFRLVVKTIMPLA